MRRRFPLVTKTGALFNSDEPLPLSDEPLELLFTKAKGDPRDPLFVEAQENARLLAEAQENAHLLAEKQENARRAESRTRLIAFEGEWRGGDTTAIAQGMHELIVEQLSEEQRDGCLWLLDAVEQLVDQRMPDKEKRIRREFGLAQRRWEMVVELRQRRFELLKTSEYYGRVGLDDRGMSLEKCFRAVSEWKDAEGSVDTVRYSYYLIEDAGGERATLESYKKVRRKRPGTGF